MCPSMSLSICSSIHFSMRLSDYLSIFLSIPISIRSLSLHPFTDYPSIHSFAFHPSILSLSFSLSLVRPPYLPAYITVCMFIKLDYYLPFLDYMTLYLMSVSFFLSLTRAGADNRNCRHTPLPLARVRRH